MKKQRLIACLSGVVTAAVAAKLLARPKDIDWEENRDIVFHAERSRFVRVNGERVHYQEAGKGTDPPLVLIHGFCSSTLVWSKVFLELANYGFRVLAPDLLGYGYSARPRQLDYSIDSQARMIVGFLDALGIDRAAVLGASYGGAVAGILALDYPERVERLILVGAVTNNEPTRFLLMRLFGSPILGDILSPLLVSSRRLLRRRMKKVYDRHSWMLDERRVDARHGPLRTSGTHRAIVRTVRRWDADRIQRQAHLITQPTMLVWGENDPETPLHDGEILQARIPGSRLFVFRECGHIPHEEFPETFTRLVADFCIEQSDNGKLTAKLA
jgi:pimeloyl-ACP methyl ester carboxylesterase